MKQELCAIVYIKTEYESRLDVTAMMRFQLHQFNKLQFDTQAQSFH